MELGILDRSKGIDDLGVGNGHGKVRYPGMRAEPPTPDVAPDHQPLSPSGFASAVSAITSAFGDPTRRDIYLFVRQLELDHDADARAVDGVTASVVAERFELHPNVARHHLEKLAAGGYLEVRVERAGGESVPGRGAGRPSKRYRAAAKATELEMRVRHDDLLVTLLGKALAMLPPDAAEAMAEEVGAEYGRTLAGVMTPADGTETVTRSFRSALHAVADALSSHGFAAHAEDRDGELRIVSGNCPFGDVAIEHPMICAVDRGMVRGMLSSLYGETTPVTESSLAMGDTVCTTAIGEPRTLSR